MTTYKALSFETRLNQAEGKSFHVNIEGHGLFPTDSGGSRERFTVTVPAQYRGFLDILLNGVLNRDTDIYQSFAKEGRPYGSITLAMPATAFNGDLAADGASAQQLFDFVCRQTDRNTYILPNSFANELHYDDAPRHLEHFPLTINSQEVVRFASECQTLMGVTVPAGKALALYLAAHRHIQPDGTGHDGR